MRAFYLCLLCLLTTPAFAQDTVTPDEFERLFSGKTVQFNRAGQPFGKEQYFTDRRVIWAFENGQCQHGIWFPNANGQICFAYENQDGSLCWDAFRDGANRITVRPEGAPASQDLTAVDVTEDFIDCPLPNLGV